MLEVMVDCRPNEEMGRYLALKVPLLQSDGPR